LRFISKDSLFDRKWLNFCLTSYEDISIFPWENRNSERDILHLYLLKANPELKKIRPWECLERLIFPDEHDPDSGIITKLTCSVSDKSIILRTREISDINVSAIEMKIHGFVLSVSNARMTLPISSLISIVDALKLVSE
jgi:hypothetical protein